MKKGTFFLIEEYGNYTIYNPRSRKSERLNESASDILARLEEGTGYGDLYTFLCGKYTSPPEVIRERLDSFIEDLTGRHILSPSHTIQCPVKHARTTPPLRRVFLEVTTECNLRCRHCYMDGGRREKNELITAEIIHLIDQAHRLGVYEFYISGGEPLLRPDLFEILKHLHACEMAVTLFTNGTFLQEKLVQALKKIAHLNLYISLDGATAETHESFRGVRGCFRKTLAGIRLAKKYELPVRGNVMVSAYNKNEIPDIIKLLESNGVYWYALDKVTRSGRAKDWDVPAEAEVEDCLITELKKCNFPDRHTTIPECGVGNFMCFISAEGNVCLCNQLNHNLHPDFMGGNIRDRSLKEVWETGTPFVKYRNIRCTKEDCSYYTVCAGGCRARALLHDGNIWGEDLFECKLHQ